MEKQPQFDRMIADIEKARAAFTAGDFAKCRAMLNVVGSIALAEAIERSPADPVAE
jgi:hypothetical protein